VQIVLGAGPKEHSRVLGLSLIALMASIILLSSVPTTNAYNVGIKSWSGSTTVYDNSCNIYSGSLTISWVIDEYKSGQGGGIFYTSEWWTSVNWASSCELPGDWSAVCYLPLTDSVTSTPNSGSTGPSTSAPYYQTPKVVTAVTWQGGCLSLLGGLQSVTLKSYMSLSVLVSTS